MESPATIVLMDCKGGQSFDGLRDLPHVSTAVSDLDEQTAEERTRRLTEVLDAELQRRKQLLAGNASTTADATSGRTRRSSKRRRPDQDR